MAGLFFLEGALVSVLMLGRVLVVGFALMIASFYTAEPAPSSSHGSLVSLPGIFINCGILFGYIVSFCLSGLAAHLSWCLIDWCRCCACNLSFIGSAADHARISLLACEPHSGS